MVSFRHLVVTMKIMTAIIAIEKGDLNKDVLVDESILKVVGSSIYIEVGEKIKLIDLIYGMMLRSGNDAATMIAINIAGSMDKFKDLMNEYANKIGMKNTCFYNSHGLEEKNGEGNTASAYDMAILTAYAMKKYVNAINYVLSFYIGYSRCFRIFFKCVFNIHCNIIN